MERRKVLLPLLMGLALPMSAESVLSDSSKVFDIDEVFVVSQPKEVFRLRQQALSSMSLGSYDMQKLGSYDLRDISQYVPNFVMPNYGSRLSSAVYVRGIGSRVNSPALGIYMDDIPLVNKASFNLHQYQLSRVDVLRGPQGTLYGQNTEGGLVKVYSKNPFVYQGTDIRVGYGSRSQRLGEVAHHAKLSDHVALSVAGFYEGQNGFFRNVTTGDRADKYNEAGGKFQLMTRLNAGWNLDVLAQYQYVDQNGFPYGLLDISTGAAEQPASTFPGSYRRHSLVSGFRAKYVGKGFDFTSVSSYQYLKDRMLMDQDYLAADYMHILQKQLDNAFTQELTWKSNCAVGGFWHWTLGSFFSSEWLRTVGPVFFDKAMTTPIGNAIQRQMYESIAQSMAKRMEAQGMPYVDALTAAERTIEKAGGISLSVDMAAPGCYHTPVQNLGFYHQSDFDLSSRLTLTLGLRYDYLHTNIRYESSAYMTMNASVMGQQASNTLRSVLSQTTHDDYNQLLPKFGLLYKVGSHGSNFYATVSKGYRAGGYNIQMFSDILQAELNVNRQQAMRGDYDVPHTQEDYERINETISYKPETSWNYEVGSHLNLLENMLHIDLCAFYMKVKNQQLSVMAGNYGFGRMMVNAGESHSCGLELALKGQLLDGKLNWAANYGYTHAIFDEYNDGKGENEISYQDNAVPYVPEHTFSGVLDYRFDIMKKSFRSLTIGADVTGKGKIYWDNANSYSQGLYAVLGAHADVDFGHFNLRLWARNITNTNYNTFAVDNAATGKKEYFAQRGNPFQCGAEIRLHF